MYHGIKAGTAGTHDHIYNGVNTALIGATVAGRDWDPDLWNPLLAVDRMDGDREEPTAEDLRRAVKDAYESLIPDTSL